MSKKDSTRTRFANSIRSDLYQKLQELSQNTDIPISRLLDRAVEQYLDSSK